MRALAEEKGLELCVTFTYAHYPVMRECKHLIETGEIGKVIDIVGEYPQDWMILGLNSEEENFTSWIGDPKKSGNSNVTAAIGVHLFYLVTSMTGLQPESVLASFGYYPKDAQLETMARIFIRFTDGTGGLFWFSNVAVGHDCTIDLKIYGDKGAIEWTHGDMTHLKLAKLGGPVQVLSANRDYLCEESRSASRIPTGHPEGFYEAFANIYRAFCSHLLDIRNGVEKEAGEYFYPKAQDGLDAVRFVQACVRSHEKGNRWVRLADV